MEEKTYWIERVCAITETLNGGLYVINPIIGYPEVAESKWVEPDCKATELDQRLCDALTTAKLLVNQIRELSRKIAPETGEPV